jgi:Zn-dependent M28 family amino/carboxypeptidase
LYVLALAFLSVLRVTADAQAKYIPEPLRKGYTVLDDVDLKVDLLYLASDKLGGRLSLQPGDDAAIQWVVGQFAKIGLTPAATSVSGLPSYQQKFDLIEYVPDREATSVALLRGGRETAFHAPAAFGAYKHSVDIFAKVIFAGYGITAPELGYDDYRDIDAKGKIVFVFDHEPQEDDPQSIFNGTGNTRYATTRVKLLNAQAHGAVALVVVAEPNRKHLTNAERAARIGGSITRKTPIPLQAIADDELHIPVVTVNDAVAQELLATSKQTGKELQAGIDKDLSPRSVDLPDTALTLHLVNKSEKKGTTSNVAGLVKGSDPKLGMETIIISGHHDHDGSAPCNAGEGGIDENGQPTPAGADCLQVWHGADDNASGTVGTVEIARAFMANKAKPSRSILFVVFASEERGLLGAYYMAQHPVRPLSTTRAMINFDMIGRDEAASPQTDGLITIPADTTNRLNLIGGLYSPDYDHVVRETNQLINLQIDDRFDHDSVLNVLFRSDQFPFLLHNIPAFWWFTGFHPDYHHITDTVEKIDIVKMRKILQLAYLSAYRFADMAEPPAFVANPKPPAAVAAEKAAEEADRPHGVIIPVSIAPSVGDTKTVPPPDRAPVPSMGRYSSEAAQPVAEPEPEVVKPVRSTRASRAAARKEAAAAAKQQTEGPTTLTAAPAPAPAAAAAKPEPERPHGVIHPVMIKSTVVDASAPPDATPVAAGEVAPAAAPVAGFQSKATVAPVDLGRDMTPAPTEKEEVPEKSAVTPLTGAATTTKAKKRVVTPVTIAPSVAPADDSSGGVPR